MKIAINADRWQGYPYGEVYAINREITSIVQRKLKNIGVQTVRVDDNGERMISDNAKILTAAAIHANLLLTISAYAGHGYDNTRDIKGYAIMTKGEAQPPTFDGLYEKDREIETAIADRIENKFQRLDYKPSTYNRHRNFIVCECVICPSIMICPEVGWLPSSESYLSRKAFIRKSADATFEGIKEAIEHGELYKRRYELYSRHSAS